MQTFETQRLTLRPFSENDYEAVQSYAGNLEIEGRPANKLSGKDYGDEYSYAILKSEWKSRQKRKTETDEIRHV